jgi:hypothetical protein
MPLAFTVQTAAAALLGLIVGIGLGFVMGAWWNALRTELGVAASADARAYRGPWPIRDHRSLADLETAEQDTRA